jgi:hypothetical protein
MLVRAALPILVALLATACVSTRTMNMGTLPSGPLVTLIVSEDRTVVERECREVAALMPVLGCSVWRVVSPDGVSTIKAMKVVRYTDSLPSPLALEIDVHELCHVVAALQPIDDPCHVGNDGVVRSPGGSVRAFTR